MEDLFDSLSKNAEFRKFMDIMAEKIVLDISNDVKLGRLNPNEEIVNSTLLVCFQSFAFPMLKALNFAWNGEGDVEGFGAINQFIDKLQGIYFEEETKRKLYMKK